MWTVVYVSQDAATAGMLAEVLMDNGILARIRRTGQIDERQSFEILVPHTEVDSAQNLIIDNELF